MVAGRGRGVYPVSRRADLLAESIIGEMTELCNQRGGINLARGYPDDPVPTTLQSEAIKAIRNGLNQYSPTSGLPELQDSLAETFRKFNQVEVHARTGVVITCGATEALLCALLATVDPMDKVVLIEPCYEDFVPATVMAGGVPVPVAQRDNWWLPEEPLKESIGPQTRVLLVNTPQNPNGKVYGLGELRLIADLCIDHDLIAVCDETYECFTYDGARHVSLASLEGMASRTLTIGSFSKTYAATGWRVGYLVGPDNIVRSVRRMHDYTTLAAPTPFQWAIAATLRSNGLPCESAPREYAARRRILCDSLGESGFRFHNPEGAFYVLADFSDIAECDDREFALRLLEETGIATVPGRAFFSDPRRGRSKVRFSFCKSESTLHECARRLAGFALGSHLKIGV
jgi:aminotransferase